MKKSRKIFFPNEFLRCLGVSPVHLRHSRVFLRVPSVSLRAHTPPSARLGWTPPLPGCTGWRHDKKSEKTRKISKFHDFRFSHKISIVGMNGEVSPAQRVCEEGRARDAQGHAGGSEVSQGHPQTFRNMFGQNRNFVIFSPNFVIVHQIVCFFLLKMSIFVRISYENDSKSALFHGSGPKKKFLKIFLRAPYSFAN